MNNSWIPFSCFSLRVLELSVCHITLKQSYFYTDMSQEAHLRLTGKQNRWHKQMSRLLSEWLIFVNQRRWIKSNWFIIIYNWVWLFFCSHRKILGMNTCGSLTVLDRENDTEVSIFNIRVSVLIPRGPKPTQRYNLYSESCICLWVSYQMEMPVTSP